MLHEVNNKRINKEANRENKKNEEKKTKQKNERNVKIEKESNGNRKEKQKIRRREIVAFGIYGFSFFFLPLYSPAPSSFLALPLFYLRLHVTQRTTTRTSKHELMYNGVSSIYDLTENLR